MLHRAHDYVQLADRWRRVAKRAGLKLRPLAKADGFELFHLATPTLGTSPGLYVSAGIHGDEPAAPEALLRWAEKNASHLAAWPLLVFPCLNPWGLRNNVRTDAKGRDLNRLFHSDSHPVVAAVRRITNGHPFAISLTMHEDYDAQGVYLYEVQRGNARLGEELLDAARRFLATDPRSRIDGRKADAGLIRRRISARRFKKIGYPEAIWLHLQHSHFTFTFETPSEADLELRIRAQMMVLEKCLRLSRDWRTLNPETQVGC